MKLKKSKIRMLAAALTSALLCIMLTIGVAAEAFEDKSSSVRFEYSNNALAKFDFVPDTTDLFTEFKDVMPGDELTQSIKIQNSSNYTVEIFLSAKAYEQSDETVSGLLSQLSLSVKNSRDDKTYAQNNADKQGDLEKPVSLGKFAASDTAELEVTLSVPLTVGDEFQSAMSHIVWIFTVENKASDYIPPTNPTLPEVPVNPEIPDVPDVNPPADIPAEPELPENPEIPDIPQDPGVDIIDPDTPLDAPDVPRELPEEIIEADTPLSGVQTGELTNILLWSGLLVVFIAVVIILFVIRRRLLRR